MSTLRIETRDQKTRFLPGEEISGAVVWWLDTPAEAVELRLFWYTQGKGTQDIKIVETTRFEHPGTQGTREFRLRLPDEPYSFSGKLISLLWALELFVEPSEEVARLDITMSPTGGEILLGK
jgi:hypothetical protein